MRSGLVPWLLGVLAVACGASPSPPRQAPAQVEATEPETERRPYGELSTMSVAPTESPGMWLRVAAAQAFWGVLPKHAKYYPLLRAVRELTAEDELRLDPALASVIDWSQPIDVVANGPVDFEHSWSFRVRSPEAVLRGSSGLLLRRVAAGVWDIAQPPAPPEEEEVGAGGEDGEGRGMILRVPRDAPPRSCRLHHLPAPVGYRILCSESAERRDRDTAFLLSRAPELPSSLHFELGGEGYEDVRASLQAGAQMAGSNADPAEGGTLPARILTALLENDHLSLDVALSGTSGKAELVLDFPAKLESPALTAWLELASKAQLPPSLARLPNDADVVLGLSGFGAGGVDVFVAEYDAGADTVLSARDEAERQAAMKALFPADGRFSMAAGYDTQAALAVLQSDRVRLADETDAPVMGAANDQLQEALGGWQVFGIEQPPDRYLAAVRRYYRSLQLRGRPLPRDQENLTMSRKVRLVPGAIRGLPPATVHLVFQFRADARGLGDDVVVPQPYEQHFVFMPDGERVWLVTARSARLASEVARKLMTTGDRVEKRAELAAAQSKPTAAMLWLDVTALALRDLSWDVAWGRAHARKVLLGLNRAPHSGKARLPLVVEVEPRKEAPGWRLRVRSEASFVDFFADVGAASYSVEKEVLPKPATP